MPVAEAPAFTFDAVAHKYYLGGAELPSVTKILKEAGLAPTYHGASIYALRGTRLHEAAEWYDLDDLDLASLGAWPADWRNRFDGYRRFKDEQQAEWDAIEQQGYHPLYLFAGTRDRRGVLRLLDERAQLDLKFGQPELWHKYQTAGYYLLPSPDEWKHDRRGCVYFDGEGKYKLVWHDDPNDLKVFLAATTITHAKQGRMR